MKIYVRVRLSRRILLRLRNVLQVVKKINTHFMFNNCFSKIVPFMR